MKQTLEFLGLVFFFITWLAGLVLAKGFWMTTFALFPPVAWYRLS